MFSLVAVITVSCNKNQKVVKQISGSSYCLESLLIDGDEQDFFFIGGYPNIIEFCATSFSFDKCKVKKEDCRGTLHLNYLNKSPGDLQKFDFTYSIIGDGEKIIINYKLQNDSIYTMECDIDKWEDDNFNYVFIDDSSVVWKFFFKSEG